MLDLGLLVRRREGRSDPRAHGRPARSSGRGAAASARLPHGGAGRRRRSSTSAAPDEGAPDARARGRDPPLGRAARRRRCVAIAPSSPTSSSARPSIARSWRRRASPPPRTAGGLADIAQLPLTEKREIRATCTPDNPIGAHLCATPSEIVRIYSTSGTTGTPSYIPLTAGDLDNWVTGVGAQLRGVRASPPASASSPPTTPGRSWRARRSPPSSASASVTSRSAPATPSA